MSKTGTNCGPPSGFNGCSRSGQPGFSQGLLLFPASAVLLDQEEAHHHQIKIHDDSNGSHVHDQGHGLHTPEPHAKSDLVDPCDLLPAKGQKVQKKAEQKAAYKEHACPIPVLGNEADGQCSQCIEDRTEWEAAIDEVVKENAGEHANQKPGDQRFVPDKHQQSNKGAVPDHGNMLIGEINGHGIAHQGIQQSQHHKAKDDGEGLLHGFTLPLPIRMQ